MGTAITDERADEVFGALADATRRGILSRAMGGDLGISELAEPYPMSFAAVQKHVAVLERAGLVRKRPDGRRRVVTTDMDGLRTARAVLEHYEELWRGRVGRMHELLELKRASEPRSSRSTRCWRRGEAQDRGRTRRGSHDDHTTQREQQPPRQAADRGPGHLAGGAGGAAAPREGTHP